MILKVGVLPRCGEHQTDPSSSQSWVLLPALGLNQNLLERGCLEGKQEIRRPAIVLGLFLSLREGNQKTQAAPGPLRNWEAGKKQVGCRKPWDPEKKDRDSM